MRVNSQTIVKEERLKHMTNCYVTWYRKVNGSTINMNI